jgi:HSF-type DNA-binding
MILIKIISQRHIMTTGNTPHPPHLKFPLVLHTMLEDAQVQGFEHVVSWLPNSNMFKIHNSEKFTQDILKHYFPKQKFYKSFLRQLNIYGFDRINAGLFRGAYFHSSFVRGDRELPSLSQMERVRVNTTRHASYSNGSVNALSCMPYDDFTTLSTPTPMETHFWSFSSSWTKQSSEPPPLRFDLPSTSIPQAPGGMNGAASPWEEGVGTEYAPSIPDAFVRDIILLFGSDAKEDNIRQAGVGAGLLLHNL